MGPMLLLANLVATLPLLTAAPPAAVKPSAMKPSAVKPSAVKPSAATHWSWQPMSHPVAPPAGEGWARTEIDRFIHDALDVRGLAPSPEADRRTLLRRLSLDLVGLPPTPGAIEAFESDTRPDAYDRAVDALLADPAHGERWARHWLDVARYADSNGLDENTAFGNAWRYRDWVVRALNANIPVDRFIRMQVAGDLMPGAADPATAADHLTATGFLVLGPKVLAEPDKEKLVYDLVDEQVDVIGKAFLAESIGCARCHDHKFDPVSQADYFALAGILKSTQTMATVATVARVLEREAADPASIARRESLVKDAREAGDRLLRARAETCCALAEERAEGTDAAIAALDAAHRHALAAVPAAPPHVIAVRDEAKPTDLAVHARGDHTQPKGDPVRRTVPSVLASAVVPPTVPAGGSGRAELATWLVDAEHPLTARVFVNRVWHWHFGQGLVDTPSDFGTRGGLPSNPALLDWLARDFVLHGWDLRRLHRQIVTSATYRQASAARTDGMAIDPGNTLLWRWAPRRLEAEAIRDAVLAVSGALDRTLGGSLLTTGNFEYVTNDQSNNGAQYAAPRRSLYLPVIRNAIFPFFATYDYTDPSISIAARPSTVIAPQALWMLNSPFVLEQAKAWSARLHAAVPADRPPAQAALTDRTADPAAERVALAYRQAFGRRPTDRERSTGLAFLAAQSARGPDAAWAAYAQVLLASSEFITIE